MTWKHLFVVLLLCYGTLANAALQQNNSTFWYTSTTNSVSAAPTANKPLIMQLKLVELVHYLSQTTTPVLLIPTPNGAWVEFVLTENNVIPPSVKENQPNLKSYDGVKTLDNSVKGKFNLSRLGFHAVFQHNGRLVYIDPSDYGYRVYFKTPSRKRQDTALHIASSKSVGINQQKSSSALKQTTSAQSTTIQMRQLRVAFSTTGEYTTYFRNKTRSLHNTAAIAEISVLVNRLNLIFNRDLAINLVLAEHYDRVIYPDASDDPFTNVAAEDIAINTQVLNKTLGAENYDIGHLLNTTGGGRAYIGAACDDNFKAGGVSGGDNLENDAFYVDYVAHELGHQLGALHTFNGTSQGCGNNSRHPQSAYEPGSGVTIMSYSGICGDEDLEDNYPESSVYDYFHLSSVHAIRQHVSQYDQSSQQCGTLTSTSNSPPTVYAGANYQIPAHTPFILAGTAEDKDADALLYSWEQFDLGAPTGSASGVSTDFGSGPIIRNFGLSDQPIRIIPAVEQLVQGYETTFGELLPTTHRPLTFNLVVRDGNGAVVHDQTLVNVTDTGQAFALTSPLTGQFNGNSRQTVRWQVADTDRSPINCQNVDIYLSTDAGQHFSTKLLTATVNDGEAQIIWPNITSSQVRLRVKCSDNIFFDINRQNLTLVGSEINSYAIPVIAGQRLLTVDEDHSLTLLPEDLSYAAGGDTALVLMVEDGENYHVADSTITPAENYFGELTVPIYASNSSGISNRFDLSIRVNAMTDAPTRIERDATGALFTSVQGQTTEFTITDIKHLTIFQDKTELTLLSGVNYSVSGQYITPSSEFSGQLQINANVSGQGQSDAVLLILNVTPVNIELNNKSHLGAVNLYALILLLTLGYIKKRGNCMA